MKVASFLDMKAADALAIFARRLAVAHLHRQGTPVKAASAMGIHRNTLYRWLRTDKPSTRIAKRGRNKR